MWGTLYPGTNELVLSSVLLHLILDFIHNLTKHYEPFTVKDVLLPICAKHGSIMMMSSFSTLWAFLAVAYLNRKLMRTSAYEMPSSMVVIKTSLMYSSQIGAKRIRPY